MRNLIICCDGTGNEYGKNNTNVVDLYSLALKTDHQVKYYDPGVGTGGWEYDEETGRLTARSDLATGKGLQRNVLDAYEFLMDSYVAGDRLFLFGFSRGAFTARSLAGMLHKCGLLRRDNDNLIEYASKIYNTAGNDDIAAGFKATFCDPCPVYFIGVWDTVKSLVMNAGKKFHDHTLNPEVKFGYHAISVDERRKDFPSCGWDEASVQAHQTIEQVWFSGVHSDVGGWYDERDLSNITLKWMLGKASAAGMVVDDAGVAALQSNPHGKIHESYSGFWKFRGSRTRKIPEGAWIHRSVFDRKDNAGNKYKPKNLPENFKIVD